MNEIKKAAESKILAEQKEKRDRNTKYFLTENHGGIAAVYPYPVHYEENGEWKEIDNSLREENTGEEGYENKAACVKVKFAKHGDSPKMVTLKKGSHKLSWGLENVQADEKEKKKKTVFRIYERQNESADIAGEIPEAEERINASAWNRKQMHLAGTVSGGIYENIREGVDLEYLIQGETVKENVILKEASAAEEPLRFCLNHKGLTLSKEENGELIFRAAKKGEDEEIFRLKAPCMYDAAGSYSAAVSYEMETVKEGETILTIRVDQEWLKAKERQYPVVIDPNVETIRQTANIRDTFVREKYPNSSVTGGYGSFVVGNNAEYGRCRSFIVLNTLPQIPAGAIIYDAKLCMYQYQFFPGTVNSFYVNAHEVTGSWSDNSATWNNQPSYDSRVLDRAEVKSVVSGGVTYAAPKTFNITKQVRKWYKGNNLGICLKMHDESVSAAAGFVASDHPVSGGITTDMYPFCMFYYRDAKGLEDYYSYHEQRVGRAGTCYVNDFNGNLVVVHPDTVTSGNRFPVSLSHVYNAADREKKEANGRYSRYGCGWRLSAQKELRASGIADYPYVYTDEDGTNHYFYRDREDSSRLKDEDGLGLIITQESSSDETAYRKVETKGKVQMIFRKDGYLSKEIDPNGNTIEYLYESDKYGSYLSRIKDPSGAYLKLFYNTDGKLYMLKDEINRITNFFYEGDDLKSITYPDGKESRYGYGVSDYTHLLMYVKAPELYEMYYGYVDDGGTKRVKQMTEHVGSQMGKEVNVTYCDGNVTIFEEPGLDGNINKKEDNRYYTYQFDTSGRPVCVYDQDGKGTSYGYYTEGKKNNRLSRAGSTARTIQNHLLNTRFEDGWNHWEKYPANSSRVQIVLGTGYIGKKSARVIRNSVAYDETGVQQIVEVSPGKYTVSAYYKVTSISQGEVYITVNGLKDSGAETFLGVSAVIKEPTDSSIDDGWQRRSVSFTVPSECKRIRIRSILSHGTGTCYMTCFQLEEGEIANKFNLMENGSFERLESGSATIPASFTGILTNSALYADGVNSSERKYGSSALRIYGEPGKRKGFWKRIPIEGSAKDVFSISGWAKGKGIPGKEFGMVIGIEYEDKDANGQYKTKYESIPFNPHVEDWQFVNQTISADAGDGNTSRKYRAILFHIFYGNQANDAYFDGIQIIRDDGKSYVYDEEGNLISARTAAANASFSYDKNKNLTRMSDITGTAFEYGYDEKQNLKRAASSEQVIYQFQYDTYGNPVQTTAYGERRRRALVVGRCYYIREKVSGKYLEVPGSSTSAGTAVQLNAFQGSTNQKWKAEDAGAGYLRFLPLHDPTKALNVQNGSNSDNTKVDIAVYDSEKDAQKFKLISQWKGDYQIAAKCSKDKRVLTNAANSTADGALVTIWGANDSYDRQKWCLEPADLATVSDEPEDGSIFAIRARHSGQYLDVPGGYSTSGTVLQQYYYNGTDGQSFRLQKADSNGNYYLRPICAPAMALTRIANDAQINRAAIILRPFSSGNTAQKFQFKKVGTDYAIWNEASNEGLGIMGNSWGSGARIVTDGSQAISNYSPNKRFVLENRGKQIRASMAHTSNGKQVASVTDNRGYTTTNTYDSSQRLLTKTTDAKGNVTNYAYDSDTDQLRQASAAVDGKTTSNTYTYDKGDRLSSIGHNGFSYNFEYDVFGNPTKVKVGNTALESYTYLPYNGPRKTLTYANGKVITNEYDKDFRLIAQKHKESDGDERTVYENAYDGYDNLVIHKDLCRENTCQYDYDLIGRMTAMEKRKSTNNEVLQKLQVSYDDKNRVESVVSKVGGITKKTGYMYGNASGGELPGLVYGIRVDGFRKCVLSYDQMARLKEKAISVGTGKYYRSTYTYVQGKENWQTTILPEGITNGSNKLKYTYDALGNIAKIYENNILKVSYTYDGLNRLARENNQWLNKSICYSYDAGGNILAKKEYAYTTGTLGTVQKTISYGYGNTGWKDQITSYNGQTITYDAMGNPLTYRDGMKMLWYDRKYLTHLTKDKTYYFAYDSEGKRIEKHIVNGHNAENIIKYYWNGEDILAIQDENDLMHFVYDQDGHLFSIELNGTTYYYIHNLQKDIIGLIDSNGTQVVSYRYDTWGNPISMTDTSGTDIGTKNPFRYREYLYDEETGLYHLDSRFYDPVIGRFVSPDDVDVLKAGQGNLNQYNLYAYCLNNPVNYEDSQGMFAVMAAGIICSAVINAGLSALEAYSNGENVGKAFVIGGISGAASGILGLSKYKMIRLVGSAVVGGVTEAVSQKDINIRKILIGAGFGFLGSVCAIPDKYMEVFSEGEKLLKTLTFDNIVTLGTGTVSMGTKMLVTAPEEKTTSWSTQSRDRRYYSVQTSWSSQSKDPRYYPEVSWSVKSHDPRYY